MDHEDIKARILQEIDKTERQISHYRQNTKPIAPDNAIGRISRMDAIINKTVMESSLIQAENRVKKLKKALSNLTSPDFGICIQCGNSIPVGRILIMPETLVCVHCAQ
ncbi:MAG: TraR/DksA C4-type zinc finger protein [Desulfotignum sp.]|nr:TraR/DksA C4-type zinc finger protein [Desulfotignum sp.]